VEGQTSLSRYRGEMPGTEYRGATVFRGLKDWRQHSDSPFLPSFVFVGRTHYGPRHRLRGKDQSAIPFLDAMVDDGLIALSEVEVITCTRMARVRSERR
jgi:hypothetical protein